MNFYFECSFAVLTGMAIGILLLAMRYCLKRQEQEADDYNENDKK